MKDIILLVEDDETLGDTLQTFFEDNGLSVIWTKEGIPGIRMFKELNPVLVLLDVLLPDIDGFEVAMVIRKLNNVVPILFMTGTALNKDDFKRAYQALGATNYMEKPINPFNALAQIQSLLHPVTAIKEYTINDNHFRIDDQLIIINGKEFQLRENDAHVFSLLLENTNKLVLRRDLLHKVWKDDKSEMNNALDISISHIKKNLSILPAIKIKTIHGKGYRLIIE